MSELFQYVIEHGTSIVEIVVGLHAVALVIVNLTPTPKDNEVLAAIYKPIEWMAGVLTSLAKDKGASK